MKLNKYIFAAGAFIMALTSCTDLDVDVVSQYTEYPNNEIAVEAKMADVYFQMRGPYGRRYFELLGCASDEFTALAYDGGYYDGGFATNPSYHASSPADATVDWYGELTSGITKANKIIIELGGEDADPAAVAPARAMRAFFTYILMDLWGDTPIMEKPLGDGETVDRTPRPQVAEWIESELTEIYPLLTEEVSANTYGKPTKWMALGLLARLYTNWPVFACADVTTYDASNTANPKAKACSDVCDQIINSGKFSLGSMEYRFKFNHDNGPKVEDFIYAMPYDTNTQQGMQHGRAITWKDLKSCDISYYGTKMGNSFGGYMALTPEFSDLFNLPGDQRNNCVIGLGDGTVYTYDPATLLPTNSKTMYKGNPIVLTRTIDVSKDYMKLDVGANEAGYSQGRRPVKFFIQPDQYNNGRNQSNDFPIIRYADILLMKAEAMVRAKESGSKKFFNEVRSYAKAPELSADPTLAEIYDERGREFMCECLRRDDMIRFGHYEDEFFPHYKTGEYANYAKFDKTARLFPIHQDILNTNKNWKQNAGY